MPGHHRNPPGSSPLARGTRADRDSRTDGSGLIPARAGNTQLAVADPVAKRAHPRSRGEHVVCSLDAGFLVGSSPLARGTLSCTRQAGCRVGLIPARAGNTGMRHLSISQMRAHPRSRGEHTHNVHQIPADQGSSPLARGTRSPRRSPRARAGLIPARAGNT